MVQAAQDHGGFSGPNFNVLGESLRYCVVMVLMAIICFQAPSLASALTGGAAVQQGLQMVTNVRLAAGGRSGSAGRSSAARAAERSGRAPACPMPRAAPQASPREPVASSPRPWPPAPAPSPAQGYGAMRTAAYRLAALRGRA